MSKSNKITQQSVLPDIKVGPFKPVKYYEASVDAPSDWVEYITKIGREVITDEQYLNIGFNYILTNAINNEFELSSLKKKKKK